MTGGGCVPLIPYLILRSRGEAFNPKHTHTLSHSLTNVSTYSQRLMQPLQHTVFVRIPYVSKENLNILFLIIVYPYTFVWQISIFQIQYDQ